MTTIIWDHQGIIKLLPNVRSFESSAANTWRLHDFLQGPLDGFAEGFQASKKFSDVQRVSLGNMGNTMWISWDIKQQKSPNLWDLTNDITWYNHHTDFKWFDWEYHGISTTKKNIQRCGFNIFYPPNLFYHILCDSCDKGSKHLAEWCPVRMHPESHLLSQCWKTPAFSNSLSIETYWNYQQMAVCQNLVPLVNIKIAGKWMFIPLKMVLIGIDPYPNLNNHHQKQFHFGPATSAWSSTSSTPKNTETPGVDHPRVAERATWDLVHSALAEGLMVQF